ncbi:glycosyltransferase family 2 protein [Paenibacillus herberti]|nr:glycosyltransferase family 2 protein [Paenibacillus herberti]
MVSISVVVPSYRRTKDLIQCLKGLDQQKIPPLEVIVVYRSSDEITENAVKKWMESPAPYVKKATVVSMPGMLAAMKAGSCAAEGEVIAFTDDDAVPRPEWIERLAVCYQNPLVGGAGGRDIQPGIKSSGPDTQVGILTWYGKLIGNHHIGSGAARNVDVLKGVNMSFRSDLLQLPEGLKGSGAQVHIEVHICLRIRKLGFKLIYDPRIEVDHYPAPRFDADQRNKIVPEAVVNAAHNLQYGILNQRGNFIRTPMRLLYASLVGDRSVPGLARFSFALLRKEKAIVRSFVPAQKGLWKGLVRYMKSGSPKEAREV